MARPNILLILNDDMGFSDLGCYGGEVQTPTLDRLAENGLRFTQFYNTARCCPSRASLLTGLYPHQADVGDMVGDDQCDGYLGDLSKNAATIAEVLKTNGYATYMSGKWHVTGRMDDDNQDNWPCQRGFDEYYGMLCGAGSFYAPKKFKRNNTAIEAPIGDFYFTDAISDEAVNQLRGHFDNNADQPFFQYLAYTAPHWPLHAREVDIERYRGRYDCGWDQIRKERLARMRQSGILGDEALMSPRDPSQPDWNDEPNKDWQARRMEVYAAQIDCMDRGIGRVITFLEKQGALDNTLVVFLADNGGCNEEIVGGWASAITQSNSAQEFTRDGRKVRVGNDPEIWPGAEDTYASYGTAWANVSNTPFRKYKKWIHEGGISTPFIVHWPKGIAQRGELRKQPAQLPDVMATILDVSNAHYPEQIGERKILPHEGFSLNDAFENKEHKREVLYWEHEGNCGIRKGPWKLVCENDHYLHTGTEASFDELPWELYHIEKDRSELMDRVKDHPDLVKELSKLWLEWAKRCHVRPFKEILRGRNA